MGSAISRRRFIRNTGLAATAAVGASWLGPKALFGATPFVRRDIGNLDASNPVLESYRAAITAMQALPSSDPLSWAYQAAIHGTTMAGSMTSWNTCQHGTQYFLSWHRMYLYYFERIVRKLSGDPCWALPYWAWEDLDERMLPPMFRTPTSGNPLFVANRNPGMNAGTSSLSASATNVSGALAQIPFNSFQGQLEGPHGSIHVSLGGWMGSVPTAAQDPIFWLHHGNVDRFWNLWLAQGGGRTMPLGSSAADLAWKNTKFTFFDENRNEVQLTGCDVLRAQDQLDYVYECEPVQVEKFCRLIFIPPHWLEKVLVRIPIPWRIGPQPDPPPFAIDVTRIRRNLVEIAKDRGTNLTLQLSEVVTDRQPDIFWEVFVGLPKGAERSDQSPHFVGVVALFGHGIRDEHDRHGEFESAEFAFDIDEAVAAALERDPEMRELTVTFVPRGPDQREGAFRSEKQSTLTIGRAAIVERRLEAGREDG